MAHAYSDAHGLPTTGLRFFTVYGPWGRPDMALFLFTRAMLAGEPIQVFNHGEMSRDFTYIDDIVAGVVSALDRPATPLPEFDTSAPRPDRSAAPFRLYNIGRGGPVSLLRCIELLEECLGVTADKRMLPSQPGDVLATSADISGLVAELGYAPQVSVEEGVERFVDWYREYYSV
jgi:UDP-glucuronate 4-epimerase